ncbi:MAG: hypothetical protein ACFFDC_21205 [Promethearchaeota archaeon]
MIRINRIKVFFIFSLFSVVFLLPFSPSYSGSTFPINPSKTAWDNPFNLLTDGNLTYHSSNYLHIDPLASNESEIVFNVSSIVSVQLVTNPNATWTFMGDLVLTVEECYQKLNSTYYYPYEFSWAPYEGKHGFFTEKTFQSSYHYNLGENLSSMDLFSGQISAEWDSGLNIGTLIPKMRESNGHLRSIFEIDAQSWRIEDEVAFDWSKDNQNFIVTNVGQFNQLNTWVLEAQTQNRYKLTYHNEAEYDQNTGLLIRHDFWESEKDYEMEAHIWISDFGNLIDNGNPSIISPAGKIVWSMEPIVILFDVLENHFESYNFYRNTTLIESNNVSKQDWNFTVTPTSGNTTYTLEIKDTLGFSENGTTWIKFSTVRTSTAGSTVTTTTTISTTRSTSITTTITTKGSKSITSPLIIPAFKIIPSIMAISVIASVIVFKRWKSKT